MKETIFTINEAKKIIEKCKVLTEREVRKWKKIIKDRYVCIKDLVRRLELFWELKEKVLSELH